jgi:prepilin-type processing-associated H-X9-DG protein
MLRQRGYSLDSWLQSQDSFYNANGSTVVPQNYPWAAYKLSNHHIPPPSGVFAFIDEHEQSINGGNFMIEQPYWVIWDDTTDSWFSLAADRHRQGCNLSFLDGHVEHWRWRARKIYRGWMTQVLSREDLADHRRIQEAVPHDH